MPENWRRYERKEFCKNVKCDGLDSETLECRFKNCVQTARDFHRWLNESGFCIRTCELKKPKRILY